MNELFFNQNSTIKVNIIEYEKQDSFNMIIGNLILSLLNNKNIVIGRRPAYFASIPTKYRHKAFSYRKIIPALDFAVKLGLAKQSLGYFDKAEGTGRLTRVEPTEKFKELISVVPEHFLISKPKQPVILKSKKVRGKSELITFTHTSETKKMATFVNEFNEFASGHIFSLKPKDVLKEKKSFFSSSYIYFNLSIHLINIPLIIISSPSPSVGVSGGRGGDIIAPLPYTGYKLINSGNKEQKCSFPIFYYRVFNNGNFNDGGRFFAAIQNLRKELRRQLLFDGQETIELDYAAFHIAMLYNIKGTEYKGDPYIPVSGFSRKEVKVLFQILINSKNERQAINAGMKHLKRSVGEIKRALEIISDAHSRINSYFCSGIGIRLQNYDSQITEEILSVFMRQDIPIIGVHDSFIVPASYGEQLNSVMTESYREKFKFEPTITVN